LSREIISRSIEPSGEKLALTDVPWRGSLRRPHVSWSRRREAAAAGIYRSRQGCRV